MNFSRLSCMAVARDLDFHLDGTGQALIRRGKTDAEGQGRAAYLSFPTRHTKTTNFSLTEISAVCAYNPTVW
jgi:hypothetical protein